ncbi:MAG TPA: hypothetical protein PKC72_16040 [Chitinophagaceae bacterium]|nr:hypothetical protein [Chitinophagaceae bacterium]
MKQIIPFCWLISLALIACKQSEKNKVIANIPGNYIRFSEHEFGKEYDTLIIAEIGGQFQITRKWKYERILDGVIQEPEYKQETSTAVYDEKDHLLHENESGNTISFDNAKGTLFIGSTKYKKLK